MARSHSTTTDYLSLCASVAARLSEATPGARSDPFFKARMAQRFASHVEDPKAYLPWLRDTEAATRPKDGTAPKKGVKSLSGNTSHVNTTDLNS